jgi:hypothetical protein
MPCRVKIDEQRREPRLLQLTNNDGIEFTLSPANPGGGDADMAAGSARQPTPA